MTNLLYQFLFILNYVTSTFRLLFFSHRQDNKTHIKNIKISLFFFYTIVQLHKKGTNMILNIFKALSRHLQLHLKSRKKRKRAQNDSIQISLHFQVSRADISSPTKRSRTRHKNGQTISYFRIRKKQCSQSTKRKRELFT